MHYLIDISRFVVLDKSKIYFYERNGNENEIITTTNSLNLTECTNDRARVRIYDSFCFFLFIDFSAFQQVNVLCQTTQLIN